MLIFKEEINAGLKEHLAKARVVSYCSQVEKMVITNEKIEAALKAVAAKYDWVGEGLYPTKSILVSTVWNLNDDVFDKYEVWVARRTPEDKPTNNNHNEKEIVGHITGNWTIDEEGNLIPDDVPADGLPDTFHIFNTAVIYTSFSDPEMMERAVSLVTEIEEGRKFVSMEAYFKGFDYALRNEAGEMKILQRNEQTAFLTKHLRAYGGTGEYEGHKVGRLLRGITFSGKGYVDKPANPDSIIFSRDTSFDFISAGFIEELKTTSGVYNNQMTNTGEEDKMSQELETKIGELTVSNEGLTSELETVKSENAQLLAKIAELTQTNEALASELTTLRDIELANVVANRDSLAQEVEQIKAELGAIRAEQKQIARKNKLMVAGYSDEDAVAKVAIFEALSDEQFDVVANELAEAMKGKNKCKDKEDMEDEKEGETESQETVATESLEIESVEAAVNPAVAAEQKTLADIRNELANTFEKLSQKRDIRKK